MKKAKITSLLTVTLAAMSFFSCSSEIETPENGLILNPGDVQISIGLGSGSTSYSTTDLENMIHGGSGKLFTTEGAPIDMKNAKIETQAGKLMFSAVVSAGSFTEDQSANLYFYVNGTPTPATTGATDEAKFAASTVDTPLDYDLSEGLPAGFGPKSVVLKSGSMVTGSVALKRAAARVGATFTSTFMAGYKVELQDVNTTSGSMFQSATVAGKQKVTKALDGNTTGMYKTSETVGYVYPSTGSSVVVTAPSGDTKKVNFAPEAGKNYTVKITPANPNDVNLGWDVTIEDWTNNDVDVDFNGTTKLTLNNSFAQGNVSVQNGKLVIEAGENSSDVDLTKLTNITLGTGDVIIADIFEATRAFKDNSMTTNNDSPETGAIQILHDPTYNQNGKSFVLTVSHYNSEAELLSTIDIPGTLKPTVIPEGFLVNMGEGLTFAALNTQGSISQDIALFNKVNASSTSGTFAEKLATYLKKNEAQFTEVVGKKFANSATAMKSCPTGFKLPTLADYKKLLANTFNIASNGSWSATAGIQYNVRARNAMETIHDGSSTTGAVVSTDYSVGIFNTGITTGETGNKSYRVFSYKGNSIVLSSTGSPYGGLYTGDGLNIGMNGNNASSTVYTEATGTTPNMNLRCIKDDTSSAW